MSSRYNRGGHAPPVVGVDVDPIGMGFGLFPSPYQSHQSTYPQQRPSFPPPAPRIPYAPLPLVNHPDPHLNPILVPRQGLVYDVRETPLNAKVFSTEITGRWNDQAATVPSVAAMTIVCARFEDPIVVRPMISTSGKVTVLDVLFAVHKRVHRVPNDPSTFSLLEPVGYRGGGRARRGPNAPIEGSDGGSVVGVNAVASGRGVGPCVHVGGRRSASMVEQGWTWVGILPSKAEAGVWILELR